MTLARQYAGAIRKQLGQIEATQLSAVEAAGAICAAALCHDRWIYAFGTGHSHLFAEELFYRAGGLARVRPMLHGPLMLHESASGSTECERDPLLVDLLLNRYPMEAGDVLLIASNSGRNPVPVELAMRAAGLGAKVIGLTNRRHSEAFPSRHGSGKKLGECVDVLMDNCGVVGDACVDVAGADYSIGSASTVTGSFLIQMMVCHAIETAMHQGWNAEVFSSSNGGNEGLNESLLQRYGPLVRHL